MLGLQTERGQSNTVGAALLISVVLLSGMFSLAVHTETVNQYQALAEVNSAEDSMMYLASEIANVAHDPGTTSSQMDFLAPQYGSVDVRNTGNIRIRIVNTNTFSTTTLLDAPLGTVRYTGTKDAEIVYQGGGIWRKPVTGEARMVSPPPIQFEGDTLLIPVTRIAASDSSLDSTHVQVRQRSRSKLFPDPANGFQNPVSNHYVVIDVQSRYYNAWGQFFENRADADSVTYLGGSNTVRARWDLTSGENYVHIIDSVVILD